MNNLYTRFLIASLLSTGVTLEKVSAQVQPPIVTCHPDSSGAIGCFVSVKPTGQTETIVFPESHTFQMIAKTGTTKYTGTEETIPGNNDFTGFVGKNGSSNEGYLSINHENSPGGVSMVGLRLNDSTMVWEVDSVKKVDFSPLVRTVRNCSGGVTPWGTIITSEENTSLGDANGDGYQDVGWQVEIDPITGRVVDYDSDGQPDKLWSLGRMSHENIVIASDSVTVYQAEDGGSNCVYKFIANAKTKLSDGTLYVLKRDLLNPSIGIWVVVPNTTKAERNATNSLAGSLGGTNWSGAEDVELGPDGKVYFTSKGTGTIWRFKDKGNTVEEIEAWVTNKPYEITHNEGTTTENWGTGIDNLTFDGDGNLWALQDGGRNHLWVVRPDHTPANPKIDLFMTTPAGSEPTGLTFSSDYKYGFISIQHPSRTNTTKIVDAAGDSVQFNRDVTFIFARKSELGKDAKAPYFELGQDMSIGQGDTAVLAAYLGSDAVVEWKSDAFEGVVTGGLLHVTKAGTYYATATKNKNKTWTDSIKVEVADGHLLREIWTNIPGGLVYHLTSNPSYPDHPDVSTYKLTEFEVPSSKIDNYGQRLSGFITPPKSGYYTFFISGDDNSQLWLSSDEKRSNRKKIAGVPSPTSFRNITTFANQKSDSIYLEFGKKYYIDALNKESIGANHVSVGWKLTSGEIQLPISGSRLFSYMGEEEISQRLAEPEIIVLQEDGLFPNPTSGPLNVTFTGTKEEMVNITVQDSYQVFKEFEKKVNKGRNEFHLDLKNLKPGIYILKITSSEKTIVKRVIISSLN